MASTVTQNVENTGLWAIKAKGETYPLPGDFLSFGFSQLIQPFTQDMFI